MQIYNQAKNKNKKVVFIMGATGTGKSRLSIHLATRFNMEVINCDKIQVYRGLDIITNKISEAEMLGVPHHLLSVIDPTVDFTAKDFCRHAILAMNEIVGLDKVPIIVGGSNSFIQALVEDPYFKSTFDCCFIWLDVSLPVLDSYVAERVDDMTNAGFIREVREIYEEDADNNCGIRRAIGVPEMDKYLKACVASEASETKKKILLKIAIEEIKVNTCDLVSTQVGKIRRLRDECDWPIHRIDSTLVFKRRGTKEVGMKLWEELVAKPSTKLVSHFLGKDVKKVEKETRTISNRGSISHNMFLRLCSPLFGLVLVFFSMYIYAFPFHWGSC